MQRGRGSERLFTARHVVILKNEDIPAGQGINAIRRPLAVTRDRSCAVTEQCNAIRIFLAFAQEDTGILVLIDFGPAVDDALDAVETPYPAALAIRSALPEVFRFIAHSLIK